MRSIPRGFEAIDVQMLLACTDEIQPDPELTAWLLRLAWPGLGVLHDG